MSAVKDHRTLDLLGIFFSSLCLVHCLALPFFILLLPMLARYYLTHPFAHIFFAFLVLPTALTAFWRGYREHGHWSVLFLGLLGAVGVLGVSILRNFFVIVQKQEIEVMLLATGFLMVAHGLNYWSQRSS